MVSWEFGIHVFCCRRNNWNGSGFAGPRNCSFRMIPHSPNSLR
ncbi:hypothetical protein HMPREF1546_02188 [Oscillibacter sp. KLE 1745]|nr:hypothetical protein HMPREF1546_02188 [Oscillibacter sp. KLE 1745]